MTSSRCRPTLRILLAALLWISLLPGVVRAALVEEVVRLPVTVQDAAGVPVSHEMIVTIFRDDARLPPHPVAVIGHGRAARAEGRAALGRARYEANARWLAGLGFLVAIPTRIGYGETGGDDLEAGGPCRSRHYPPGFRAAADQMMAALDLLRSRPDAAPDRGIVLGQSYGGASAIALAARNPAGIQAVINFAGGSGGDPVRSPGRPCAPAALEGTFGDFGATARIATLWIYAANDRYFGAAHPRQWFAAYRAAGGDGEFIQYPPHGRDGHGLFTEAPALWQPRVLQFLRANGFPELQDTK